MAKNKPRSKPAPRPSVSELRRSLKASHGEEPTSVQSMEMDTFRELHLLRKETAKKLESLVEGIDSAKVKAIIGDHEKKQAKILDRGEMKLGEALSAAHDSRANGTTALQGAGRLGATGLLPFTPTYLTLKPILIWAAHTSGEARPPILKDAYAASIGMSWARIFLAQTTSLEPNGRETFKLTFYYLWWNETDYFVLTNAWATFIFEGASRVSADGGVLFGGSARVNCYAFLRAIQTWRPEPNSSSSVTGQVFDIEADGSGFLNPGAIVPKTLSGELREVQVPLLAIPPGEAMRLEASVFLDCYVDDGYVEFDFSTAPSYARSINCQVQLEVLTAPSMMTAPSP